MRRYGRFTPTMTIRCSISTRAQAIRSARPAARCARPWSSSWRGLIPARPVVADGGHRLFPRLNEPDLASPAGQDQAARYLTSARAVILVLHPLQLPGARGHARPEVIGPERAGTADDRPAVLLSQVTGPLLAAPDSRGGMVRKPVAVVVAKLDAVEHALPAGSPLTVRPALRARFDIGDGDAVHAQVEHLIDKWDGPQFNLNLRAYFTRYRYFGISSLGSPPKDPATVRVVVPYRVHDLALWLLGESGAAGMAKSARASRRRRS